MTTETLTEAEKLRRVPGIFFMDEITGRCAKVVGTGLGVWEIIKDYREAGNDRAVATDCYDWLSPEQIDTAIRYYTEFPEEIDSRIDREYYWTPETLYAAYPWARPKDV